MLITLLCLVTDIMILRTLDKNKSVFQVCFCLKVFIFTIHKKKE